MTRLPQGVMVKQAHPHEAARRQIQSSQTPITARETLQGAGTNARTTPRAQQPPKVCVTEEALREDELRFPQHAPFYFQSPYLRTMEETG